MGLTEIAPLDRQKQILTPSKIVRVPRGHPLTERLTGDSALLRTWKRTGIAKAGGAKSLKCLITWDYRRGSARSAHRTVIKVPKMPSSSFNLSRGVTLTESVRRRNRLFIRDGSIHERNQFRYILGANSYFRYFPVSNRRRNNDLILEIIQAGTTVSFLAACGYCRCILLPHCRPETKKHIDGHHGGSPPFACGNPP